MRYFGLLSNMAPYVLDLDAGDAVRLVDLVDVDSEKWRSYAEATTDRCAGSIARMAQDRR